MKQAEHSLKGIRRQIRMLVLFVMISLIFSGITAFPIESELAVGVSWISISGLDNALTRWILHAYEGMHETNAKYPFIAYGTDWLAFGHLVIGLAFIGPLRDPVRNIWVIEFAMIACAAVVPVAFIAGEFRGIPVFWRIIDCMFGIAGGCILWRCHSAIKHLEKKTAVS